MTKAADAYYEEHYKGRGLAPKHVIQLKALLTTTLKKPKAKVTDVVNAWLTEKAITLKERGAAKKAAPRKAKAARAPEEKPQRKKKTPPVAEEKIMNRTDLKATIAELRAAGVAIKTSKTDTEAMLQAKVNDAMQALASPSLMEALAKIDPTKVLGALGQPECFALYIDLRDASCAACKDAPACMKAFLVNLKGNFSAFEHAVDEIKTEAKVAKVTPEAVSKAVKAVKAAPPPQAPKVSLITYEPKRRLFMMVLDENPVKETEPAHSTIALVMGDPRPVMTEKELRKLIATEWDLDNDAAFAKDWIAGLRDIGVIKFEGDLLEEEREALAEAGVI